MSNNGSRTKGPNTTSNKGNYCPSFVYIPVNPVSFLNVLPLMNPTSLFRKYYMHHAMLFIWYKYKFDININAIHMQH